MEGNMDTGADFEDRFPVGASDTLMEGADFSEPSAMRSAVREQVMQELDGLRGDYIRMPT
jgi:hypothetical protein